MNIESQAGTRYRKEWESGEGDTEVEEIDRNYDDNKKKYVNGTLRDRIMRMIVILLGEAERANSEGGCGCQRGRGSRAVKM